MTIKTVKISNGSITLPKNFQKLWKNENVFIFPSENTIIIKKLQGKTKNLSEIPSRISSPKMSIKKIQKEIENHRREK